MRSPSGFSRRDFVSTAALATAGLALGSRRLSAEQFSEQTVPNALFADPMGSDWMQTLALAAIDAAKSAGATYADVRVSESQTFDIGKVPGGPLSFYVAGNIMRSYGVRAMADGGWGFVHGDQPTTEAVTDVAKGAVAQAKTVAKVAGSEIPFASAPVVKGEWKTPMEVDPFAVPIHEQMALIRSWMDTCGALRDVGGLPGFSWSRETRVFASTDGSLVTQTFNRGRPGFGIGGSRMMGGSPPGLPLPVPGRSGGYEIVDDVKIHDLIRSTALEVQRYAALPGVPLDIGRYPVVMDGYTFGTVLARTVGQALEMDRVLGREADASGTSYLSPADRELGTVTFAPALEVHADRALPSVTSVKWDDEGVEAGTSQMIKDGALVDYQTSRQTVGALQKWYQQQNRPLASSGNAVAPEARNPVQVRCGHLTVTPSTKGATIDDLIHGMSKGVVALAADWISTDQELTTGNLNSYAALLLEVQKGKIVRRVKNGALEWSTLPFLKKMEAVGDASTVREAIGETYKGVPWHPSPYHVSAPAALFKEVAVIDMGRSL